MPKKGIDFNKNSYNMGPPLRNKIIENNINNATTNELIQLSDGEKNNESTKTNNNLVNNFANENKNSYNGIANTRDEDGYTGSKALDLIRDSQSSVVNFQPNSAKYKEDFIENINNNLKLDETFKEKIEESKNEKKKFAPVKKYKNFLNNEIKILMDFIFDHSDDKFTISVNNYDKFTKLLNKTTENLQEDLDKKDDKEEPKIDNPLLRTFILKTIKALKSIDDNNGFSFDPTTLTSDLSLIKKNMSYMDSNISLLKRVLTAIHDFFTMTNSRQNLAEIKNGLAAVIEDINLYYKVDLEKKPALVTKIIDEIAEIENLISSVPFIPEEDIEQLDSIKEALDKALEPRLDSSDIIMSFVKTFGEDAIKNINVRELNNKKIYNHILNDVKKYIKNNSDIKDESKAKMIAKNILSGQEIDDIKNIKKYEKEHLKTFFRGKVRDQYDKTIEDMEENEKFEDAKIKGNDNLRKADAITKQTKKIIESICIYVEACNQSIDELARKYSMHGSFVGNIDERAINRHFRDIRQRMISGIETILHDYKYSFYEYIDNNLERQKALRDSKRKTEKIKQEIEDVTKKKLYDKDENPKAGKEADILEIKNILSNMKDLTKLSFNCWESIQKIISNLKYQNGNNIYFNPVQNSNTNLLNFMREQSSIENNFLHSLIDRNALNLHHKNKFPNYF